MVDRPVTTFPWILPSSGNLEYTLVNNLIFMKSRTQASLIFDTLNLLELPS